MKLKTIDIYGKVSACHSDITALVLYRQMTPLVYANLCYSSDRETHVGHMLQHHELAQSKQVREGFALYTTGAEQICALLIRQQNLSIRDPSTSRYAGIVGVSDWAVEISLG